MEVEEITDPTEYEDEIRDLLIKTDEDFYPPLSERKDTKESDFQSEGRKTIDHYLNSLIKMRVLCCFKNDTMAGILSFTRDLPDRLNESDGLYVSTIVVYPDLRQRGVAKSLIRKLKQIANKTKSNIYTRTWSKNKASQAMFNSEGFDILKRIENDRGSGVDSIYYYWKV